MLAGLTLLGGCRLDELFRAKRPAPDEEVVSPPAGAVPAAVERVSGNEQVALAGTALPEQYLVRVLDSEGRPIGGLRVQWTVESGGGSVAPASSTTDASGVAGTTHTLGDRPGEHQVTATVVAAPTLHTSFVSRATRPNSGEDDDQNVVALRFTRHPSETKENKTIEPPVTVLVTNRWGTPISGEGAAVTISITPGSSRPASMLRGTLRRVPVNGIATFSDLKIRKHGNNFRLRARVGEVYIDSNRFEVKN